MSNQTEKQPPTRKRKNLSISVELYERLRDAATRERRTVTGQAELFLEPALDRHESKQKAAS